MATPQEEAMAEAANFVDKLNDVLLFPIIYLLSGVAFMYFLYGAFEYIMGASSDQAREQGKKHLMYGIIGLVVMSSAYIILWITANTFGLGDEVDCAINPTDPTCVGKFEI
jgi:hypothetical protein